MHVLEEEAMYLSLATTFAFFVVKAIGLQELAKNRKIKHSWLAWVPILNKWVTCKMAGPHQISKRLQTNHLFVYLMVGSSLMSYLIRNRTPLHLVLFLLVGAIWLYLTYVMVRDFYVKVLGKSKKAAVVAMVVSPLDAIWIYNHRECSAYC